MDKKSEMHIRVENKYENDSSTNVHCRSIPDSDYSTIVPTDRKQFNYTDEVVLFVKETNASEPKRFGYIKVEWRLDDSFSFEGNYEPNTKTAAIRIISESVFKPKTVNVQVGGN